MRRDRVTRGFSVTAELIVGVCQLLRNNVRGTIGSMSGRH